MAVNAIASVGGSYDLTTTDYTVLVSYIVKDGSNPHHGGSVSVVIPFGTDSCEANEMLRQGASDDIFIQFGLTIAPEDIYYPFLARLN